MRKFRVCCGIGTNDRQAGFIDHIVPTFYITRIIGNARRIVRPRNGDRQIAAGYVTVGIFHTISKTFLNDLAFRQSLNRRICIIERVAVGTVARISEATVDGIGAVPIYKCRRRIRS